MNPPIQIIARETQIEFVAYILTLYTPSSTLKFQANLYFNFLWTNDFALTTL